MNTPVSPKVTAGAAVAALVGLLLQYVTTITPESFAFLGSWEGLAFLVVTLAGGALAAWWKTDPLRVPAAPAAPAAPADVAPMAPVDARAVPTADASSVKPVFTPAP